MIYCTNCGKDNPPGANFCSACGGRMVQDLFCASCSTKLLPQANFCHNCGLAANPQMAAMQGGARPRSFYPQPPNYAPNPQFQTPVHYTAPPTLAAMHPNPVEPEVAAPPPQKQSWSTTPAAEAVKHPTSSGLNLQPSAPLLNEKKEFVNDANIEPVALPKKMTPGHRESEQADKKLEELQLKPTLKESAEDEGRDAEGKRALKDELGKYLPEHIVKQIMQKGSMEEEMKNVTIIFADISGFTAMSEDMDPEEVTAIMNECFQSLVAMVDKYGGMVNKFIGDCVMAIFGAPVAHENDPERAVRCTLGMMAELTEFNKRRKLAKPLGMSIGVNCGKVFAGIVGSAMRKEYTVMGDNVNLAQRLESAAVRGQILIGMNVYKATRDLFEFEEMEPIAVKGKKEKVKCFVVKGEKKSEKIDIKYRWEFVNRRAELEKLGELKEEAFASRGQVCYIKGEAGIGKSRLLQEFIEKVSKEEAGNASVFRTQCMSHATEISYFPVTSIIRGYLQFEDSDAEDVLKGKLEKLKNYGLEKTEIQFIGSLFALKYEDSNTQFFDEAKKKQSIFIALKSLFQKLSRVRAVIFCIDNLQWIDPLSKEFLSFLTEDIEHEKLLILLAARQKTLGDIGSDTNFNLIELAPFDNEKLFDLTEAILNSKKVHRRIKSIVWERSGGNPLFAEEILKSFLDDKKILQNASGHWELSLSEEEESDIPQNIHSLIASRIDRLPENAKKLLQHLSVLGREFKYKLIQTYLPNFPDLDNSILVLKERDILMEMLGTGDRMFSFKSLLLVEVGYSSILKKNLKKFHEAAAKAIETLFTDRLEENFELLCHHYLQTDANEKALFYLERAAEKLFKGYQLEGAANYYHMLMNRIKDGIEKEILDPVVYKTKLLDIYKRYGDAALLKGDLYRSREIFTALSTLAKSLENSEYIVNALVGRAESNFKAGEYETAIATLEEALTLAEENNFESLLVKIMNQLGQVHERRGEVEDSINYLKEALRISEQNNDVRQIGLNCRVLGNSFLFSGDYQTALDYYNKALPICEESQDKATMLSVLGNIGIVYLFQKDYENSLNFYSRALRIAREVGDKIGVSRNLHNIGELYYEREMYVEALKSFEESLPMSAETGWKEGYAQNLIYVGYLKFITNINEEAEGREVILEGISLSEKSNFNRSIPLGKYFLALTYMKDNDSGKAEDYFNEAMKIAENTGFKKMIDDINLQLTKLHAV